MADARRRRGEYWAALAVVTIAAVVAILRWWPVPATAGTGSWIEILLADRVIVGVLRLVIVLGAFYFIGSIPALVVGGRWVKGFGTGGIVADETRKDATNALEGARRQVAALQMRNVDLALERAELWNLVDVETRPD
jgi:hypothetical protein